MTPTRLLVLGIDGASPELLRRWSGEGKLPGIAALLNSGRSASTEGLEGFFIGSTWPSIHTGTSPAGHGFHYQFQLTPGSYDFHSPMDHGLFARPPFWRVLSDAGRRVAVLDAPLSPLEATIDGVQVVEWGGHDALYGYLAQPAELQHDLLTRFGPHPVGVSCDGDRRDAQDYAAFVERLLEGVATKARMSIELLERGRWDLFMQVFSEAHCAGHQCWHLHDPGHPAHDPAIRAAVGDPLERVYRRIDQAIGEILDCAGDCTRFVFSSHGMSHWYGAQFLLPRILLELGVSVAPTPAAPAPSPGNLAVEMGTRAWHALPVALRDRLRGLRERYGPAPPEVSATPSLGVDLDRSACFHQRIGLALGGVRLNLKGREPRGLIAPGAEAEAFCDRLSEDLLAIVDERTGRPLIRRVLRVAEIYDGPNLQALPDLVVDYDDTVPTGSTRLGTGAGAVVRVSSPRIGILEGHNDYGRSGEHRSRGLVIADGPGIEAGEVAQPVSVLDLAPTWSACLDVPLPEAEGQVIAELTSAP